jgi:flagellin
MGLSINQNIAAVNSYRNLSNTQNDLSKSLEKLSSGFRINRAADDAAGLAISEGLRSQVGGLKVAARNAQDGISVVQTAEGALTEVHAILQRLRDLGVQAANDSNNASARTNITTEATQLTEELGRISESTNFNGTKLLNGAGTLNFQVGADGDANSAISVDLSSANVSAVKDNLANGLYARTGTVAAATVTGDMTVTQGSVEVTVAMGAAGTYTTTGGVVDKLNSDAGFSANFKAAINSTGDMVVTSKFDNAAVTVAGTGYTAGAGAAGTLDFTSHATAQAAVNTIDLQIESISTARANLGAMQNRFEHTVKNINVAVENLSASESRIRDTDMASEMVSFTRAQILSQAGTAMLAQANQIPQGVLSLLR